MTRSRLMPFLFATLPAFAQDYPYDEAPTPESAAESEEASAPTDAGPRLPVEGAGAKRAKRERAPSLQRVAFKAGVNFALLSTATDSWSGIGLEGAFALSWDLAYQPIALETELGYRSHFLGDGLHMGYLRFATFYRHRIGRASMWKYGLGVSLDGRMDSLGGGDTAFSLLPAFHLIAQYEYERFLLEPYLTIYRLDGDVKSLAGALRAGIRF